jgi:hypothetical protein
MSSSARFAFAAAIALFSQLTTCSFAQKADQLRTLHLPQDFTLSYRAVQRPTTSERTKALYLSAQRANYNLTVKSGQMSQDNADQQIQRIAARLKRPSSPAESTVILSSMAGNLFIEIDHPNGKDRLFYDGKFTFYMNVGSPILNIKDGLLLSAIDPVPLPGVGLPSLELIRSPTQVVGHLGRFTGDVPVLNSAGANVYAPGQVDTVLQDGLPKVTKLVIGSPENPNFKWDYLKHEVRGNLMLASQIRSSMYLGEPGLEAWRTCDYSLIKYSDSPLDTGNFDVTQWIIADQPIVFTDESKHIYNVNVTYNPQKGDILSQVYRQMEIDRATLSKAENGSVPQHGKSGLYLTIALVFTGIGYLLWKWQRRTV